MTTAIDAEPKTFKEAMELIQISPTLRTIKSYIDKTNFSADVKAMLYDIAKSTVKIGEKVIAIGRYIFSLASEIATRFPNLVLATIVALIAAALLTSTLGAVTIGGKAIFAGLASVLSKLMVAIGVTKGFLEDLRNNTVKTEVDHIATQFEAMKLGVIQK
jgi:histone H3/H4